MHVDLSARPLPRTHTIVAVALRALLLGPLVLGACAQGGGRRDVGGGALDAAGGPDARMVAGDAGPLPDARVLPGTDTGLAPIDAGTDSAVAPDAYAPPGVDAFVLPPDAYVAPVPDAFVRPADAFVPPADAFVVPDAYRAPDAASSGCSESPCRLVAPQCGCTSGQSCYPNGATRVCAATGTRAEGSGCAAISDCTAGLGCVNFSSDATMPGNMCSRICATDADCASGSLCIHEIGDGAGGTVPGLRFCSRGCTPAPNTGCAPGLACTLFTERTGLMRDFTDCAGPVGTGRQGFPCVDETDCAAGFGCADAGLGLECLSWCRVSGGSCPLGTASIGVAIVSGVEWGLCA